MVENIKVVEVTMVMDNTEVVEVPIVEGDTMVKVSRDQTASGLLVNKILPSDKSILGLSEIYYKDYSRLQQCLLQVLVTSFIK